MSESRPYPREWRGDPETVEAVEVVAANVSRRIAEAGLSHAEVAERCDFGFGTGSVRDVAYAAKRPSPGQVDALADALGCTPGDLLDGTDADALWPPCVTGREAETARIARQCEAALAALEPWQVRDLRQMVEVACKSPGRTVSLG